MKASRVESEKVVKVEAVRLDLEKNEAAAIARALSRALPLVRAAGNTLDVDRFEKFLFGLSSAIAGNETSVTVEAP